MIGRILTALGGGAVLRWLVAALGLVALILGLRLSAARYGARRERDRRAAEEAAAREAIWRRMDSADVSRGDPDADARWLRDFADRHGR